MFNLKTNPSAQSGGLTAFPLTPSQQWLWSGEEAARLTLLPSFRSTSSWIFQARWDSLAEGVHNEAKGNISLQPRSPADTCEPTFLLVTYHRLSWAGSEGQSPALLGTDPHVYGKQGQRCLDGESLAGPMLSFA